MKAKSGGTPLGLDRLREFVRERLRAAGVPPDVPYDLISLSEDCGSLAGVLTVWQLMERGEFDVARTVAGTALALRPEPESDPEVVDWLRKALAVCNLA